MCIHLASVDCSPRFGLHLQLAPTPSSEPKPRQGPSRRELSRAAPTLDPSSRHAALSCRSRQESARAARETFSSVWLPKDRFKSGIVGVQPNSHKAFISQNIPHLRWYIVALIRFSWVCIYINTKVLAQLIGSHPNIRKEHCRIKRRTRSRHRLWVDSTSSCPCRLQGTGYSPFLPILLHRRQVARLLP